MQNLSSIVRGDTVDLTYSIPIDFGSQLASISAQIRKTPVRPATVGDLVDEFIITQLADTSECSQWNLYVPPANTFPWPIGTLQCDIKHITPAGDVAHTEKFALIVSDAVTQ